MKSKLTLLFLSFLLFTSTSLMTQQDSYYWSSNQKHSLQEDRNHVSISVSSANVDVVKSKIQAAYSVRNINLLRSASGLLIVFSQNAPSLESLIRSNPEIEAAAYGQRLVGEGPPVFLTGEILLQPKEGMEIHEILRLISGEYLSYEATKYDTYTIRIKDWQKVISLANKIYESDLVRYSHPNFIAAIERYQVTPTDPLYVQQYYLNQGNNIDINAPQAWQLSRGLNQVRVAVIDDGVEAHEDLNARVLQGFTPTDPNGFGAPLNNGAHGQACAGIIGATHDNVGIAGVSPCTQIIPINIFTGQEDINDLRDAIDWAWNEGNAEVLSNSWGFQNQNANFDAITFAINRARTLGRGGLGSVVVFASGNENQTFSGITFPANVNGVIAVGAVDRNGNIWNYSSRGPQMDLVAPSGNVGGAGDLVTTDRMGNLGYNNGNYANNFGGTSAAAPQVAGVAALMLSVNAALTESQVRTILQNTATDMGAAGFDNTFGFGRVNALAALQQALPPITGNDLMCLSANFTLQNVPAGAMATWSVNPTNLFTGSTSGSGATANLNSSGSSGQATLTYTLTSPCGNLQIQRSFWVGTPQITNMRVNNMSYFTGMNVQLCPGNHWLNVTPVGGNPGNASWTVPSGIPHFVGTNTLDFTYPQNYSNSLTISVRASNACGQGANSNFFLSKKTFGCTSSFSMVIYPNPAKDQFSVEMMAIDKNAMTEEVPVMESAVLLDKEGREIALGTRLAGKMTFEVSNLRKGIYFIHVVVDGELTREQIIIE
jgi:hypothetical protein